MSDMVVNAVVLIIILFVVIKVNRTTGWG